LEVGPPPRPEPAAVECQDAAAIIAAAAAVAICANKTPPNVLDKAKTMKEDIMTKTTMKKNKPKKKKNKPKRNKNKAQKREDIDEATPKEGYWGGAFASSSHTRMVVVVGALTVLFAILTCTQGILGGKNANAVGGGPPICQGPGGPAVPLTIASERRLKRAVCNVPDPKNCCDGGCNNGRPLPPDNCALDKEDQEANDGRGMHQK
jgi:hypothetical protein